MTDEELQEKVVEMAQGETWAIHRSVNTFDINRVRNTMSVSIFKPGHHNGTLTDEECIYRIAEEERSNQEAYDLIAEQVTAPGQLGLGTPYNLTRPVETADEF